MDTERFRRLREIFDAGVEKPASERDSFLTDACAGDPELLAEVEALLARDAQPGDFTDLLGSEVLGGFLDTRAGCLSESWVGSYRLNRVIGSGGMGTVFEATQESPHRTVALKMMRVGLPQVALRRFEYESEMLARLSHPGIARIYQTGTHTEQRGCESITVPYFAMELIERPRTILEWAREERPVTRSRLELFIHVCEAVHHAHQKGIVHRDLKPGNILVDATGQPKVIDFGVARATDLETAVATAHTQVGQIVGTLQYMSPEQCNADPHDLDTRSDVYSLGVVLYELLTERLPYQVSAMPVGQALRMIQEQAPARPSNVNGALRGDLETILLNALEKDRDLRYGSAAALAEDLRRYLSIQPILARPPSVIYQLRTFARRNKVLVTAAVAVLLSLSGGLGVATWQAVQAKRQATRADKTREFLVTTLASADPFRQIMGTAPAGPIVKDRKVADVLEASVLDLDAGTLSDQPEVEASIRHVIGSAYLGLGRWRAAEPELRRALEIRRRVLGDGSPATLDTMTLYGTLLVLLRSREREGRSLLREAIAIAQRELGPEDLQTLAAMQANLLDPTRTLEANQAQAEALLRTQESVFSPDDPRTLFTRTLLTSILFARGMHSEFERLARETVDVARRALGDHPTTYLALAQWGIAMQREDEEQAELIWSEAADGCRRHLGAEHPWTIQTVHGHAISLMRLKHYDKAEKLFLWELKTERAVLGEENVDPFKMWSLAQLLGQTNRSDEAVLLARQAVSAAQRLYVDDHGETARAMEVLASLLVERGEVGVAIPLWRDAIAIYRRDGTGNRSTTSSMTQFARLLESQGEFAEAEQLLRDVVAMHRRLDGDTNASTLSALNQLAWFLYQRRRLADAELMASEAAAGYRVMKAETDGDKVTALDTLAVVLRDLDRGDEAETVFVEALFVCEQTPPESPTLKPEVQLHYGEGLLREERYEEAEALLRDGYQTFAALPDDPRVLAFRSTALSRLIELYESLGRPEKAAQYRAKLKQSR